MLGNINKKINIVFFFFNRHSIIMYEYKTILKGYTWLAPVKIIVLVIIA